MQQGARWQRAPFCPRTADEVARHFHGLEVVEPGIASVSDWRPITDSRPVSAEAAGSGAVAEPRRCRPGCTAKRPGAGDMSLIPRIQSRPIRARLSGCGAPDSSWGRYRPTQRWHSLTCPGRSTCLRYSTAPAMSHSQPQLSGCCCHGSAT
ncbi:SAM-dependent methyltransferase [Actinoplanes hulinensis]|uniref:SAM-dependent methyltransferase n=1 Tax=Actinoplanes hulinensis TaxID=1144547 RepID=A0ABS7BGK2_9ACTN|nr:SAM-dependent methyltransferase [Actinoplanes hulinensis]MBW6440020.1 SAM-dependent methyltransferase [Actinoplanes hulinensis]